MPFMKCGIVGGMGSGCGGGIGEGGIGLGEGAGTGDGGRGSGAGTGTGGDGIGCGGNGSMKAGRTTPQNKTNTIRGMGMTVEKTPIECAVLWKVLFINGYPCHSDR